MIIVSRHLQNNRGQAVQLPFPVIGASFRKDNYSYKKLSNQEPFMKSAMSSPTLYRGGSSNGDLRLYA